MKAQEFITELRDRMYQYIRSIVPTWPEYIVKDWLYANQAKPFGRQSNITPADRSFETLRAFIPELLADMGLTVDTKWQLVPDMKFTMDMWEPKTKQQLIARAGGKSTDPGVHIPARDAERHATQAALAKQQGGVRKEPVIIIKTPQGYKLLEGWHRTIQHFARYPDGYTGPAYVAVAQGRSGVAENMDHSQDDRAVEELRAALLAKKDQLQSASDDQVYDIIDKIMTRIARSHSISGQKLHDMWVDRYKQIPDTWIMNEQPTVTEAVYRGDWVRHPDNPWQIGQIQNIDRDQALVTWKKIDKRKRAQSSTHPVNDLQHARREFSQLTQPTHSKPSMAEGTNHWYDAGVKDAKRGVKPNPRTYLPTMKNKRAQHPEEVDHYMSGYKSVRQGVTEDKVNEKINPRVIEPGFTAEKWINGRYLLRAVARETDDPNDRLRGMIIKAYDPEAKGHVTRSWGIGTARFIAKQDKSTGEWNLVSSNTQVSDQYQRQGIASAMYQWARELGNDIEPSYNRTAQGKHFWDKGAGVGREFADKPPEPKLTTTPQVDEPKASLSFKDRLFKAFTENFADGKGPGRPGDSQRHGIPKKATMAELERASHAKGRKGQLARWQLNMRRGRKK